MLRDKFKKKINFKKIKSKTNSNQNNDDKN